MIALSLVFGLLMLFFTIFYITATDYFYKLLGKWLFLTAFLLTTLQLLVDYGSSNLVLVTISGLGIGIFMLALILEMWYLVIPLIIKSWRKTR